MYQSSQFHEKFLNLIMKRKVQLLIKHLKKHLLSGNITRQRCRITIKSLATIIDARCLVSRNYLQSDNPRVLEANYDYYCERVGTCNNLSSFVLTKSAARNSANGIFASFATRRSAQRRILEAHHDYNYHSNAIASWHFYLVVKQRSRELRCSFRLFLFSRLDYSAQLNSSTSYAISMLHAAGTSRLLQADDHRYWLTPPFTMRILRVRRDQRAFRYLPRNERETSALSDELTRVTFINDLYIEKEAGLIALLVTPAHLDP